VSLEATKLPWSVAEALRRVHSDLEVELIGVRTQGDRIHDRSLARVGGKGLFVKELEYRLLDGEADLAVHSMKDVPADTDLPDGLRLAVIVARESPWDAFVSNAYQRPEALPAGALVGTCSLRRASQLLHARPGLRVAQLRGNVNTRLAKLDAGDFDAIVLAQAGLERLDLGQRIRCELSPELCLPGIGQGALGLECRADDSALLDRIRALACVDTSACVTAERAVSQGLGGSCLSPIAAHASSRGPMLELRARVGATDGTIVLESNARGRSDQPGALGAQVARALLAQGAADVLHG
jgi:hydroxymethylbilane synthase